MWRRGIVCTRFCFDAVFSIHFCYYCTCFCFDSGFSTHFCYCPWIKGIPNIHAEAEQNRRLRLNGGQRGIHRNPRTVSDWHVIQVLLNARKLVIFFTTYKGHVLSTYEEKVLDDWRKQNADRWKNWQHRDHYPHESWSWSSSRFLSVFRPFAFSTSLSLPWILLVSLAPAGLIASTRSKNWMSIFAPIAKSPYTSYAV